jgi:hypothetical protein
MNLHLFQSREDILAKWTKIWWEAPMEGSVLSFLKAQWKVSDTGSALWASSFISMLSQNQALPIAAMFVNGSGQN